jgi:hypothetical protein
MPIRLIGKKVAVLFLSATASFAFPSKAGRSGFAGAREY